MRIKNVSVRCLQRGIVFTAVVVGDTVLGVEDSATITSARWT